MSKLREAYDHIQQEKAKWIQGHLARNYFIDQEKRYVHPFLDDKAWGKFLDQKRDDMLKLMADPSQN